MTKGTISGVEFTKRRYTKRDHWIAKVVDREIVLAYSEAALLGNTSGWYFTVYGPQFHVAGTDCRMSGTWYRTPEAAFAAARVVTPEDHWGPRNQTRTIVA